MQLGVLVDRPVDAHHQSLRFKHGQVLLEIKRWPFRLGLGAARVGLVEHGGRGESYFLLFWCASMTGRA
jgi:hypothetical protein